MSAARLPGTFKTPPQQLRRDYSANGRLAEKLLVDAGALHAERWTLGACTIMLAREPYSVGHGYLEHRWHLSISHPSRYPDWDEIKTAVYRLCDGVTMAQVLGPVKDGEWVNIADNCFHLYEIVDRVFAAAGDPE